VGVCFVFTLMRVQCSSR